MFDRNAVSTVLAIAELSKKELYDKLLKYAFVAHQLDSAKPESTMRCETTRTLQDATSAGERVGLHRYDKTIAVRVRIDVEPDAW